MTGEEGVLEDVYFYQCVKIGIMMIHSLGGHYARIATSS